MTRGGPLARLAAALVCALALLAGAAVAQETPPDPRRLIAAWEIDAAAAAEAIEAAADDAALRVLRDALDDKRAEARAVVAAQRRTIEGLRRQLEALGPPPGEGATEEASVAALRRELAERIAAEEAVASAAQLAETRFNLLLETLADMMRERLRSRLLTRGPSPLDPRLWPGVATDFAQFGEQAAEEAADAYADPEARVRALDRLPVVALAFALSALILVGGRRKVADLIAEVAARPGARRTHLVAIAVAGALARLALPLAGIALAGFGVFHSGLFGPSIETVVASAGWGLLYLVAAYALSAAFFAPDAPAIRLSNLPSAEAAQARGAVMGLAAVLALDAAVVAALDRLRFSEGTLVVANFLGVSAGGWFLWRLKQVYERFATAASPAAPPEAQDPEDDARPIARQIGWLMRRGATLVALGAPTLAAAGYFAASRELMLPSIRTVGVVGLATALFELAREISAPPTKDAPPGDRPLLLRLTPVLAGTAAFLGGLPLLAVAWGASWSDVGYALRGVAEGVDIGGVRLSPIAFVTFAVVFGAGYVLTDIAQRVLRGSVLPQMGVAKAGRTTLSAVVGYIGVTLSALVAVGAAGIDLSNLAIVAGALSVGVGFGLQAVVNNFVSGLIILVERPIKVGDWIEVNGVHGTVQKINVRSTEIETFDRSTYIVPNADLIAQPVTNFTHTNLVGRMIVRVRIAYGADIRRAEAILREIALAHPMVLRRPAPQVLFRAFGQDGYEFEIRAFLRDVNFIFAVMSDVQFTIAERFAAEGIEVPVARRDVRIRAEDGASAAPAGRDAAPPEPGADAAVAPLSRPSRAG